MKSNYEGYLGTATQLQRWRDFRAHLTAYATVNLAFVAIWAGTGGGFFWPAFPLIGWAVGLSFQHFSVVWLGQISDADVRRQLRNSSTTTTTNRGGST